jgi:RNA polymerase sigma-70 factor, ECF subfamily
MEELVERAKQGNADAIEALLASVAPSVHRFGLRMCGSAEDADDILQDTLLNIAEHIGQFEGRSSLTSWAFMLARSACARRHRRLKEKVGATGAEVFGEIDSAPSPEARVSDRELATLVLRALDALPEGYREVILLRDVEELSAPEAASVLAISVDSLKSRLHRAREALRNSLRPLLEPRLPKAGSGCPDLMLLWSRKLEGDLSQADCTLMEQHLLSCPSCGAACDSLKRALLACRRVASLEVPGHVQAQVKAAMRTWAKLRAR